VSVSLPEAAAKSVCASGKHIAKADLTARGELEDVVVTSCKTQAGIGVAPERQ
jgi:hypothetical protein